MKKGSQFGAGEGIDRNTSVFQSNVVLPPNEKGVIFTIGVEVPGVGRRLVVARFPDTPHSPRMTNHGSGSEESIYTQAEIAEAFFKLGKSQNESAGKWSGWAGGNFRGMVQKYSSLFAKKFKMFVDEGVKRARREWVAALRSKKAQAKIKPIKEKISAAYKAQIQHSRLAREKTPDFDAMFGSGSIAVIEQARAEKRKFLAAKRFHRTEARRLFKERRSLSIELQALKTLIVKRGRSKELADEIVQAFQDQEIAQAANDSKMMRECEERINALSTPFQIGASIDGILRNAAAEMREKLVDLLLGMKAPPIDRKTKYNRSWRGYGGDTPLVESGEFANSVITEVI